MKIKKFNESTNNWSEIKIKKTYDDWYEIGSLILDYLELYHNGVFEVDKKNYIIEQFWFNEDNDDRENWFSVYYEHYNKNKSNTINYTFSFEEFDKLLEFMNNPNAYKQANKYNL